MEIYFFDTTTDGCQHLIRNGLQYLTEHIGRQVLAKNFHAVALLTGNISNINHGDIHTNIAHIGSLLTIDKTIACSTSKMTGESISIADRNSSYHGITLQDTLAAITHRLILGHLSELQNGGLECADRLKGTSLFR